MGKAVVKGIGKVTWTARIIIGLLTPASVAFGDAIFYALTVVKESQIAFALIGAGIVMYSTRKPAFEARFVALGTRATTLSSSATK